MTTASSFDGVDVADQICDGDVGGGEFFNVALFWREVCDGCGLAALGNQFAATAADRHVRTVMNFAAGDIRHQRIEQRSESAKDAAFGLTAKTEKNEIMPRQNGVYDLRDDGIV